MWTTTTWCDVASNAYSIVYIERETAISGPIALKKSASLKRDYPRGDAWSVLSAGPNPRVCREARSASCCERVLSERRVERLEVYQEQGGAALYLPAGSRRMLSTPARNGPRLSTLVRRSRTVCPSHFDRSTVTAAGSRRSASPGEVRKRSSAHEQQSENQPAPTARRYRCDTADSHRNFRNPGCPGC